MYELIQLTEQTYYIKSPANIGLVRLEGQEGCLSIPGRYEDVVRPMKVKVHAQDRNGKPFKLTAEGFKARAICHEIDHLDGILYIDRIKK